MFEVRLPDGFSFSYDTFFVHKRAIEPPATAVLPIVSCRATRPFLIETEKKKTENSQTSDQRFFDVYFAFTFSFFSLATIRIAIHILIGNLVLINWNGFPVRPHSIQ